MKFYRDFTRDIKHTSGITLARFKAVFVRYGCPEVLVADIFFCHEFAQFAQDYDLTHVTSSPRYPRSNGEAERAIRTMKSLLEKEGALLAYRATPLVHGSSPAQLLMGGESEHQCQCHRSSYNHSGMVSRESEKSHSAETAAATNIQPETQYSNPAISSDWTAGVDQTHTHQRDSYGSCTYTMLI